MLRGQWGLMRTWMLNNSRKHGYPLAFSHYANRFECTTLIRIISREVTKYEVF
jgi:hypothetical protein